ncbi:thioester domain-containing protein [Kitasatospora sp. NPDC001664]|uniref:thioester domain-containing protein n=1 Tax=Kitasatospora albolonga TaxID=68173 RepID=UPI0031E72FFB
MLATGLLAGGGFAPAAATAADGRPKGPTEAAAGTLITTVELTENDYIRLSGEKDDGAPGGLVKVTTSDGSTFLVYCLDARSDLRTGSLYRETAPSAVPTLKGNSDAGKVNWILQHGYPNVTEGELGELVGGTLSKNAAAGATQAAIWRITNHVTGVPWDSAGAELADYLASHAVDAPEPAAPLSLAPDTVTGRAGEVLGPMVIASTGDEVHASLDPAAVKAGAALTDRTGRVLSDGEGRLTHPAGNGEQLFVKAPADAEAGRAGITATASVPATKGRALVSPDSQDLLLVRGAGRIPVTATAEAGWTANDATPPPSESPEEPGTPEDPGNPEEPGGSGPEQPGGGAKPEQPGSDGSGSVPSPTPTASGSSEIPKPDETPSRETDTKPTGTTTGPAGPSGTPVADGELAHTGASAVTAAASAAVALGVGTALVLIGLARRRRH